VTSRPWFIRTGSGWTTSIRPSAPQGWMLSLAYAVGVALLANAASHDRTDWLPWAATIVALTIVYLVTIWRLSEFQTKKEKTMFMAFHPDRKHLPWLIAFFAAALAVGLGMLLS
jgi:uncharacterized membrane protein YfcA